MDLLLPHLGVSHTFTHTSEVCVHDLSLDLNAFRSLCSHPQGEPL